MCPSDLLQCILTLTPSQTFYVVLTIRCTNPPCNFHWKGIVRLYPAELICSREQHRCNGASATDRLLICILGIGAFWRRVSGVAPDKGGETEKVVLIAAFFKVDLCRDKLDCCQESGNNGGLPHFDDIFLTQRMYDTGDHLSAEMYLEVYYIVVFII
jgi:hypothetical protein